MVFLWLQLLSFLFLDPLHVPWVRQTDLVLQTTHALSLILLDAVWYLVLAHLFVNHFPNIFTNLPVVSELLQVLLKFDVLLLPACLLGFNFVKLVLDFLVQLVNCSSVLVNQQLHFKVLLQDGILKSLLSFLWLRFKLEVFEPDEGVNQQAVLHVVHQLDGFATLFKLLQLPSEVRFTSGSELDFMKLVRNVLF